MPPSPPSSQKETKTPSYILSFRSPTSLPISTTLTTDHHSASPISPALTLGGVELMSFLDNYVKGSLLGKTGGCVSVEGTRNSVILGGIRINVTPLHEGGENGSGGRKGGGDKGMCLISRVLHCR